MRNNNCAQKLRKENHLTQRAGDLERIINREIERCEKKLALQLDKVQEGEDSEHFKVWGELITANLYQIKQGDSATVMNYYDPEQQMITMENELKKKLLELKH